jgi:hypothetical protein
MDCRDRDGCATKVGAGLIRGGGIVLISHAHDGKALLTQPEAAEYLGLFRRLISESALSEPTR